MDILSKDLSRLKKNLKEWHSLYDAEDLARANRLVSYMEELKHLRRRVK